MLTICALVTLAGGGFVVYEAGGGLYETWRNDLKSIKLSVRDALSDLLIAGAGGAAVITAVYSLLKLWL
jgi:hypothetical protein